MLPATPLINMLPPPPTTPAVVKLILPPMATLLRTFMVPLTFIDPVPSLAPLTRRLAGFIKLALIWLADMLADVLIYPVPVNVPFRVNALNVPVAAKTLPVVLMYTAPPLDVCVILPTTEWNAPDTAPTVPTYKFPPIPTPPATCSAPEVVDVDVVV